MKKTVKLTIKLSLETQDEIGKEFIEWLGSHSLEANECLQKFVGLGYDYTSDEAAVNVKVADVKVQLLKK
jgi:hypothetical protein